MSKPPGSTDLKSSVEGMDKVLTVQRLSILDLLDPGEINKRASIAPPSEDEFENVLLVDGAVATRQPLIMSMKVKDILKLKKSFLRKPAAGKGGRPPGLGVFCGHPGGWPRGHEHVSSPSFPRHCAD